MHTSRFVVVFVVGVVGWSVEEAKDKKQRREETKRRIKFFKRKHKNKINAKNKLKYVTILMFSTAATGITHHQHRRHVCTQCTHVTQTRQNSFKQLLWIYPIQYTTTTNNQTQKVSLSLFSLRLLLYFSFLQISFWGDVCGLCVIDWSIQITIFIVTFWPYAILAITNNYA